MPSFIVSLSGLFRDYPWKAYSLLLKGNEGEGVDPGLTGGVGRDWEEWREGKLVGMQCMKERMKV